MPKIVPQDNDRWKRLCRCLAVVRPGVVTETLSSDDNMIERFGLDSQSLLCLILQVEEEFGIRIDKTTLRLEDVQSRGKLADFVTRHLE
jgi:acyl carrier protein